MRSRSRRPPTPYLITTIVTRRTSNAASAHTCTDNGGNTWTKIGDGTLFTTNGLRVTVWRTQVAAGPGTFSVTAGSSPNSSIGLSVEQFTGASADLSNVSPAATNGAGDPTATLPSAPAASSIVLASYGCIAAGTIFPAGGYSEIVLLTPPGIRGQIASAQTTTAVAAWSSDGTAAESSLILLEVKAAPAGVGAATLGSLAGAAAGTLATTGTTVASLSNLTGNQAAVGAAAGLFGNLQGAATGVQATTGTAAPSFGNLTGLSAARFGFDIDGTVAAALGQLQGAGQGLVTPVGAADALLQKLLGSAFGIHTIAGQGTILLGSLQGSADGIVTTLGSGVGVLSSLQGQAIGLLVPRGIAAALLGR